MTEFSEYLTCPYRYYLRRRLGLKARDTSAEELDGGAFGSLIHDVLAAFAASDVKSSAVADEIAAFLDEALRREVELVFRGGTLPAVAVRDRDAAYGEIVSALVAGASRDLRPSWVRQ